MLPASIVVFVFIKYANNLITAQLRVNIVLTEIKCYLQRNISKLEAHVVYEWQTYRVSNITGWNLFEIYMSNKYTVFLSGYHL